MAISNYTELQAKIVDTLNRSDFAGATCQDFITLAEASFRRDPRTEKALVASLSVSAAATSLPSTNRAVKAIFHDGPTYYGEITLVPFDVLGYYKARAGTSSVPRWGAIVDNTLYVAPEPSTTYSLKISYDYEVPSLSTGSPENWLLTDHPDIYLYGACIHSAPYLKDDVRLTTWEKLYERAMNELFIAHERSEQGGHMVSRPKRPLGV